MIEFQLIKSSKNIVVKAFMAYYVMKEWLNNRNKLLSLSCISTILLLYLRSHGISTSQCIHELVIPTSFSTRTQDLILGTKKRTSRLVYPTILTEQAWKPNAGNHERARWSILPSRVANQKTGFTAVFLPSRGFSHMITKLYSPSNSSNMPLQSETAAENEKCQKERFLKEGN